MRNELFKELLESVKEMRAIERGRAKPGRSYTAADVLGDERAALLEARRNTGLSQGKFAALLDVSTRTLQDWEQGRREPTGAARTLIRVAARYPKEVLTVTRENGDGFRTKAAVRAGRQKGSVKRPRTSGHSSHVKVVRETASKPYASAAAKPATARKRRKRAAKGVRNADAPVTGTRVALEAGQHYTTLRGVQSIHA